MPQMAPMLWLVLFIYFILLFIMFIVGVYYTKFMKISANKIEKDFNFNLKMYSWQW